MMYEHDGCDGCKYTHCNTNEEPCINCKQNHMSNEKEKYPDLWESARTDEVTEHLEHYANHDSDPVNHPAHYADTCSLECIQVMELVFGREAVINFCNCNAFKYMWRFKHKSGEEDLQKTDWYINKSLDLGGERDEWQRIWELFKEVLESVRK